MTKASFAPTINIASDSLKAATAAKTPISWMSKTRNSLIAAEA